MAPEVAFHTGVGDVADYAARLLRKAWRQQARVVVVAPPSLAGRLDEALWVEEPDSFLPHARWSGAAMHADGGVPASVVQAPIVIVDEGLDIPAGRDVLVNLGEALPDEPGRWRRIIEIVSTDATARQQGQARWRQYRQMGLEPSHHAVGTATASP